MDVRVGIGHNHEMPVSFLSDKSRRDCKHLIQFLKTKLYLLFFFLALPVYANPVANVSSESQAEARKSYLEDIFIWKMSDELKLSAKEEKAFTDILKKLNKEKSELNKKIQQSVEALNEKSTEADVKEHKSLLIEYNRLGVREFEAVQKLLGHVRFVQYLKIKNDLSSKMKSILIGEKNSDKKENSNSGKLPKPKVTVEKSN